ncbi:MAG: membrane fusion protein (multidrug efflux system) [Planctomycetota bacterium]|jgi:membrane fusion protein (multidrug efflux system)
MRKITRGHGPITVLIALTLASCDKGKEAAASAPQKAKPPAVVVVEAHSETVPIMRDFIARTSAVKTVEVQARVEAVLESLEFEEGVPVKAGALLYRLDDRAYVANVAVAQAQLEQTAANVKLANEQVSVRAAEAGLIRVEAMLKKAKQDVARLKPLAEKDAVPQQDLDAAIASEEVAQADVEAQKATLENSRIQEEVGILLAKAEQSSAQANLTLANLDLEYCTINSPIDGMVGRTSVNVGNIVGRGEMTSLVTISSIDPIYVTFAISEAEYLEWDSRRRERGLKGQGKGIPFELVLADDSIYKHKGQIAFGERAVNETTGTLELIASFPNPEGILRPGQFGRCRMQIDLLENAVLVPQRAIMEQQGAKFVYVVDDQSVVSLRSLQVLERIGENYVISSGLEIGERVILEGQLKVRPGAKVTQMDKGVSAEPEEDKE